MEIKDLQIKATDDLKHALEVIDYNGLGIVFVVDDNQKLVGVLTDGDIRRSLLHNMSITAVVASVMNKKYFSLPVETDNNIVLKAINDEIKIIPLIDASGILVDYASIHKIRRIPIASPLLSGNELAYITDCIKTNWISSQGKYVKQFEDQFSDYHSGSQALAVSNGTVALHLALVALGIKEGDEVIVPDLTFAASVNSILYTGATPVLVDVDPITWNMDVEQIKNAITAKTKAIMPVHLYGHPCEMKEIMIIAKENKLMVVEDCAEALGSFYEGQPVGTFGDAATFSFYGNKTITTGEGGMILFKNTEVAEKAAMLRDHGMQKTRRYWHQEVGYNYRLTNLQAAIGVAQFERLDEFIAAKKKIANTYAYAFRDITAFQLPIEKSNVSSSFWLYTLLIQPDAPFTREEMMQYLHSKGIESRPVFYTMHEMPPYKEFGSANRLLQSKSISERGISLPSSVHLMEEELKHVCSTIIEFCKKNK